MSDTPRPVAASSIGDRMKLHRQIVRASGRTFTVISPRPGQDVRFSTNRYHETWHILTDFRGARLIGRLLWGLAYTRKPDTVVVIDQRFIDTNPFDGQPGDPILLAPAYHTPLTHRSAAELRHRLRDAVPAGTIRWHTPALAKAVEAYRDRPSPGAYQPPYRPATGPERMDRIGGFIAFTASPEHLREYAVAAYALGDYLYRGSAALEIDWPNGELQIFPDYRLRVSAARVARREVLAETGPRAFVEERIWERGALARRRGRCRPIPPERALHRDAGSLQAVRADRGEP